MPKPPTNRVPHLRDSSIVAKVGLALGQYNGVPHPFGFIERVGYRAKRDRLPLNRRIAAKVGFVLACAVGAAHAQSCPQLGIIHSSALNYPIAATGAHLSGTVTVAATFGADGSFGSIDNIKGSAIFLPVVQDYVETWQVNPTPTGQTCEVTFDFRFQGDNSSCVGTPSAVTMSDTQHFTVTSVSHYIVVTNIDPAYITHRFLFLRWRSTPKSSR